MAIILALLLVLFIVPKSAAEKIQKSVIIEPEKRLSVEPNAAVPFKEESASSSAETKKLVTKSKKIQLKSLRTEHKATAPQKPTIDIFKNTFENSVNNKINNKKEGTHE